MNIEGRKDLPQWKNGGTYDINVTLYSDEAQTTKYDLTPFAQSGWGIRCKMRVGSVTGAAVSAVACTIVGAATNGVVNIKVESTVTVEAQGYKNVFYEVEGYNTNVSPTYVYPIIGGKIPVKPDLS